MSRTLLHVSPLFAEHYGAVVQALNLPHALRVSRPVRSRGRGQRAADQAVASTAQIFAVDLFAGAGGASTGIEWATGVAPRVAINHCQHAIAMHRINHPSPQTKHYCESVVIGPIPGGGTTQAPRRKKGPAGTAAPAPLDPALVCEGQPVDLLWASPDCKHFTKVRGKKPVDKKIRWLAWQVVNWVDAVHPKLIFLENVEEFRDWGPVGPDRRPVPGRKGETFDLFVKALRDRGYEVEWTLLDASHFGAPTDRTRLFLVARSDGEPIVWPEPTHGPGKEPVATAFSCVHWDEAVPSIFTSHGVVNPLVNRGRPGKLTRALQRRIAFVIQKYATAKPKTVRVGNQRVLPLLITDGYGERPDQLPRVLDIHEPLGTIVAGGKKHGLVFARLGPEPSPRVRSFLMKNATGPVERYGSSYPPIKVGRKTLYITDIGYRKMSAAELQVCQGFPADYVIRGEESHRVARIGNSVVPQVAAALVKAQLRV